MTTFIAGDGPTTHYEHRFYSTLEHARRAATLLRRAGWHVTVYRDVKGPAVQISRPNVYGPVQPCAGCGRVHPTVVK